jgi:hypothetical protein
VPHLCAFFAQRRDSTNVNSYGFSFPSIACVGSSTSGAWDLFVGLVQRGTSGLSPCLPRYSFHSFRCCLHFRIIRITAIRVFWQTDEVAEVNRR